MQNEQQPIANGNTIFSYDCAVESSNMMLSSTPVLVMPELEFNLIFLRLNFSPFCCCFIWVSVHRCVVNTDCSAQSSASPNRQHHSFVTFVSKRRRGIKGYDPHGVIVCKNDKIANGMRTNRSLTSLKT